MQGFIPNSIIPYHSYGICATHPQSGATNPEGCALDIGQYQANKQNDYNNKYAGGAPIVGPYANKPVCPQIDNGAPIIGPNGPLTQAVIGNTNYTQGLENAKWDHLVLPANTTGTAYNFDKLPTVGGRRKKTKKVTKRNKRTRGHNKIKKSKKQQKTKKQHKSKKQNNKPINKKQRRRRTQQKKK